MSGHRSGVLELAVLGLLHETPMHGYELRKRLNSFLGAFRAFGYGSLYPCLKDLLAQGLIAEEQPGALGSPLAGRRSKIVYRLTAEGKERLEQLLAEPGPAAWEDDTLELHRHGLESVEREVRWLNELIASERQTDSAAGRQSPPGDNDTSAGTSAS